MIEHNLDVIKTADHVIDMGPEGGAGGGTVVATGTPEEVARVAESYTGRFLAPLLQGREVPLGEPQAALVGAPAEPAKKATAKKATAKKATAKKATPRKAAPSKATPRKATAT